MLRITNLRLQSSIFCVLSTLAACSSSPSSSSGTTALVVTDTMGWKFDVNCGGGICALTPQDTGLVPKTCESGNGSETFILVPDPLLSIYAAIVPSTGQVQLSAAEPSRPVACVTDVDCLPSGMVLPGATYACTNGLCLCANSVCASKDGNPLTYDVLTLCQADLDWPRRCPYITSQPFAGRIAEVATLCGSMDTCATIPADCRQLTPAPPADGGVQPSLVDSSVDSGP
ncbi:MAG TPA: hypothetical protein VF550_06615 [Polyangia bacterium]